MTPKLLSRTLAGCLALAVASAGTGVARAQSPGAAGGGPTSQPAAFRPPPVRHVFVIMLENQGYAPAFGNPSADPYLSRTLPFEGALLPNSYATGHVSNDNYISFISGQAPNAANQSDCQVYGSFAGPGLVVPPGQLVGQGCVFPPQLATIANQLSARGLSWKGYMQDMGNVASREAAVCGHPPLDSVDNTQNAVPGDGYVTRHDPFVYFSSITSNQAYCGAHVVPLGTGAGAMPAGTPPGTTGLAADLRSVATTPNFSFIVPNVCYDGHDYPCKNQPTPGPSALADIDAFLSSWVPRIMASPAFRDNGLLEIVFDESNGPQSGSSACCHESPGPNSHMPTPTRQAWPGCSTSAGHRLPSRLSSRRRSWTATRPSWRVR
ncbi:MAG: alkaline phosphatase family protein [Acidimicrobiales bacterium]